MLSLLGTTAGNLLDNEAVVDTLEQSAVAAGELRQLIAAAQGRAARIEEVRHRHGIRTPLLAV